MISIIDQKEVAKIKARVTADLNRLEAIQNIVTAGMADGEKEQKVQDIAAMSGSSFKTEIHKLLVQQNCNVPCAILRRVYSQMTNPSTAFPLMAARLLMAKNKLEWFASFVPSADERIDFIIFKYDFVKRITEETK